MKKIEKRAFLCLLVALLLFLGTMFFIYRLATNGADWATFYANSHVYSEGQLRVGSIYDRTGKLLAQNDKKGTDYSSDYTDRVATVHAVGDCAGNIATGAEYAFRSDLVGYNFLTGTYSLSATGRDLYMTIDIRANKVAYNALGGKDGVVGVYNYETGQIVCMVSTPAYDPENPPTLDANDTSGIYINKFLSSTITPGSIFKLVTTAAAIDNKSDFDDWTYTCTGTTEINGETVHCPYAHGTMDRDGCLANSCNCAYAHLALELGPDVIKEYANKVGLTKSYNVDGIETAKGSFKVPEEKNINLAWAGIGQYEDQLNPCSMMVYMGAIANGGKAANPYLIDKIKIENAITLKSGKTSMGSRLLEESTCDELAKMMKNNVESNYGTGNFPNLDIYAKSGTAERGDGYSNTWFTGFIKNPDYPYAFIVCVEKGYSGSGTAGPIANKVLQELISEEVVE